jgi:hypothetical protein
VPPTHCNEVKSAAISWGSPAEYYCCLIAKTYLIVTGNQPRQQLSILHQKYRNGVASRALGFEQFNEIPLISGSVCGSRLKNFGEKINGIMQQELIEIFSIQQLRQFVSRTLCLKNDFEEGSFQITEQLLKRGERTCGVLFCLHGPRSVKLTAVWELDANSILFYGSNGERFQRTAIAKPIKQNDQSIVDNECFQHPFQPTT